MKIFILITAFLMFDSIATAQQVVVNNNCEQTDKMLAYFVTFMVAKDTHLISEDNAIMEIFQKVDNTLTTFTNDSCKSGKSLSGIVGETYRLCSQTCKVEAKTISKDPAVEKSFASDCLKVCDVHLLAQQQYVAGIQMVKKNTDCVDSKGSAISNLSKATKDISNKIPSDSKSSAEDSASK